MSTTRYHQYFVSAVVNIIDRNGGRSFVIELSYPDSKLPVYIGSEWKDFILFVDEQSMRVPTIDWLKNNIVANAYKFTPRVQNICAFLCYNSVHVDRSIVKQE